MVRCITSDTHIDLTLPGKEKCAYFIITPDTHGGAAIQVEAPNHRKLLWSKAMVVSVTEKAKQDFVR